MPLSARRIAFAAAFAFAAPLSASAAGLEYIAKLDSASESPPGGSPAIGTVHAHFDFATRTLFWRASFSGLSSAPVAAQFGDRAGSGVGVALRGAPGSPFTGVARLTQADAESLAEGRMMFNLRTDEHADGEICGRLTGE